MNVNISDFLLHGQGILIFKIPLLMLIFLYVIFLFIVIARIRALNRTLTILAGGASHTLQIAAIIQFLLALLLFLATIVIL